MRYDTDPPENTVRNILTMFVDQLDFADLESTEGTPNQGVHGVWRSILGLRAYAELAQRYPDHFCPSHSTQ